MWIQIWTCRYVDVDVDIDVCLNSAIFFEALWKGFRGAILVTHVFGPIFLVQPWHQIPLPDNDAGKY